MPSRGAAKEGWKRVQRFGYDYGTRWFGADGFGQAAAFSFYCIFAIAPLLAFSIALSARYLGAEDARQGTINWLENYMSASRAEGLVGLLQVEQWSDLNWIYTGLTGAFFLWGASLAFVRLRIAVNILLGNEADNIRHAIRNSVRGRILSIVLTVLAGLVTAFFIILTAGAGNFAEWIYQASGGRTPGVVKVLSFLVFAGAFVAIFRILPDRHPLSWRATGFSMIFALLAFEAGRFILNMQLTNSQLASAYGAANTSVFRAHRSSRNRWSPKT